VTRRTQARGMCFLSDEWMTDKKITFFVDLAVKRESLRSSENGLIQFVHTATTPLRIAPPQAPAKPRVPVLHPYSAKRAVWDMIGLLVLTHDLVALPLLAFSVDAPAVLPADYWAVNNVIDRCGAAYWTMDMVLAFFTGYAYNHGLVEMRLPRVAAHYVRTWFLLDFSINLGDWAIYIFDLSSSFQVLRLGKVFARLTRVINLLRLVRVKTRVKEVIERQTSEFVILLLGFLRLLGMVLLINHYTACGWYTVSYFSEPDSLSGRNWVDQHADSSSFSYVYLTSLHWSLTQFTPASMEVHPHNEWERLYNVVVILLAMIVFSSFISTITNKMTFIRSLSAKKREQEAMIRRYICDHQISPELSGRIWHFVRTSKITESQRVKLMDIPCWKHLPEHIRADLRLELYVPMLLAHPIFQVHHCMETGLVFKVCKDSLSEVTLLLGEDVFRLDQHIDSMFFVTDGRIRYDEPVEDLGRTHHWSGDKQELCVEPRQWACEVALWAHKVENIGRFRASKRSEIIKLNAKCYRSIMKNSGEVRAMMMKYADIFVARFNDAVPGDPRLFNASVLADEMLDQAMSSLPRDRIRSE